MENYYSVTDNKQIFRISLYPKGLKFTGVFFIVLGLALIMFSIYVFINIVSFSNFNSIAGMLLLLVFFLFGITIIVSAYSLSNEFQEITISKNQILIVKKRPLLGKSSLRLDLNKVSEIKSDKLIFSFLNIWYAFLYHNQHAAYSEDVEKFLVPHVFNNSEPVSFFEFAEDKDKDFIIGKLNQQLALSRS